MRCEWGHHGAGNVDRGGLIFLRPLRLSGVGIVVLIRTLPRFGFRLCATRLFLFCISSVDNVFAKLFSKASAFKTLKIFVPDRPQGPTNCPFSGDFSEAYGRTQNMPDTVHPRRFTTFIIRMHDGNPVINLLKRKTMSRGGENCLANQSCVREVWLVRGVWPWRELIRKIIILVLRRQWFHRTRGGN
jgi:hypothetical protein